MKDAKASLALPTVNTLTATDKANRVTGLLDANSQKCRAVLGNATQPFSASVSKAGTTLLAECLAASNLRLSNSRGTCLRVAMPQATNITITGNRNFDLILDPNRMPRRIDLNRMNGWGANGPFNNTRVVVRLSQLRADGNKLRDGATQVVGTLRYTVPKHSASVTIVGCNARKVGCQVRDASKGLKCRYIETKCLTDARAAQRAMAAALAERNACARP